MTQEDAVGYAKVGFVILAIALVLSIFLLPSGGFGGFAARIVLFTVACFIGLIVLSAKTEAAGKAAAASLSELGFRETFTSPCNGLTIGFDSEGRRFGIARPADGAIIYRFSDLASSEVVIDGATVVKIDRGSALVGGLAGAAFAGAVGAAVGLLTASRRTENEVRNVAVTVLTKNASGPGFRLQLLEAPAGQKPDPADVRQAVARAEHWHGRFQAAIRNS